MLDMTTNRPKIRRRAAVVATVCTLISLGIAGNAGAVSPSAIPGDRQSQVVADLAGDALDALGHPPASGWSAAGRATNAQFRELLAETAAVTAAQFGTSVREMQLAWLAADQQHQVALLTALTQLGAPYSSMSSDPEVGFDCSGLTSFAWRGAGLELPRPSGDQIAAAADRTAETAMAGDLVQYPGHVMISLGIPGAVVHSSNHENDVELWMASEGRSLRYGDPTESD
jgi:cell wall-associated NlpC family hydrolase